MVEAVAIACAYCGGEHQSAAQVRTCWNDAGRQDVAAEFADASGEFAQASGEFDDRADLVDTRSRPGLSGSPTRQSPSRPRPRAVAESISRGAAPASAGPDALGRHVLVAPGQTAPAPWASCDVVRIDAAVIADPGVAISRLRRASNDAERIVIELDSGLAFDIDQAPLSSTTAAPFELGPTFQFELDELHHLLWSNTVDARDAGRPTWSGLDIAIAAGASSAADSTSGDVVLPSGRTVWVDGGPIRFVAPIDGVEVVHVTTIEHGSFAVPIDNVSTADLAPDQLAAVTHPGGAARIIAPAGSGKTRVLTERARHLLTRWNLPADAISLVAFNKRAQEEMLERTTDLPRLHVRTLNAMALAIVNGVAPFAPQQRTWRTIDEPDVRRIIGDLVSFPRKRNSDPVTPWIEALSLVRLGLVSPEIAEQRYDGDVDGLAGVWPAYRDRLDRQGVVDFDDQIYRALLVLLTQPEARLVAQRACRVMLVDEFQDLTPAHLLLIRLLSAPGGAVFGVGDDDQTIYGYNGADPAWLIDFAELFPGAGEHPLEVNYRCPAGTVEVVDRLLRHNGRRVRKTIRAAGSAGPGGWSIDRGVDPITASRNAVQAAISEGAAPADIAVLARVNASLAAIQVSLASAGVPISGGVGLEFADRTAVRSVLAWLRLASAGRRGDAGFAPDDLREALRRPSRSFHPRINDWVTEQRSLVDLHRLAVRLNNDRDTERVAEFAADIATLQKLVESGATTSDVVFTLIDEIGLAGSVATLDTHRRGMNRAAQGDDLTAVRHLAALHDDPRTFEAWLRAKLAVKRSADGVVLATVHRVKGQEWPHVVVHLADADQYPHRLADDVEEERRLFHVAITRSSRHATIVTGPRPSPFVEELTSEPSERRVVSSHRPDPAVPPRRASAPSSDPAAALDADGQRRFEALKVLRNELRDGKPAYVVFDNKTLVAIARDTPGSSAELARIPGIGPAKLEQYGDAVLDLLESLAT
jgi:DNA helicase II / ATP-dependent DNA helicase PcrA